MGGSAGTNAPLRKPLPDRPARSGIAALQRLVRRSPRRYARPVTPALESVIFRLSSLPADDQDLIAGWLESELESEQGWRQRFAQSHDALNALADEAVADALAGRTPAIDPNKM
jgi:hypothetical protein